MKDMGFREKKERAGKVRYRDTVRLLKACMQPVEPSPGFTHRLEELCESMGAPELFGSEIAAGESGHRGIIIGGAIFSALPFVGVAAYAIRKHLMRRRVVPIGV